LLEAYDSPTSNASPRTFVEQGASLSFGRRGRLA
jgi:hypothetical protein